MLPLGRKFPSKSKSGQLGGKKKEISFQKEIWAIGRKKEGNVLPKGNLSNCEEKRGKFSSRRKSGQLGAKKEIGEKFDY